MKPAWDSLAQEYKNSDKVVVADVDCTAEGKDLCERFGVQGFPTIKCAVPRRRGPLRPPPALSSRAPSPASPCASHARWASDCTVSLASAVPALSGEAPHPRRWGLVAGRGAQRFSAPARVETGTVGTPIVITRGKKSLKKTLMKRRSFLKSAWNQLHTR